MFQLRGCNKKCMETNVLTDAYSKLNEKLHNVACRFLRDDADASDAVQDAFCNLWSAPPPVTSKEASNKLFFALKNICLNKLRHKKDVTEISNLVDEGIDPPEFNEFGIVKERLLQPLPPLQRQVFCMHVFDDMEYEEIALRLGMNVEAVRTNMSRARKKIREQYKKEYYE